MFDFTSQHLAVDTMIKTYGSSCKLTKVDGTTASTFGVLLSGTSKPIVPGNSNFDSYISSIEKTVYVSGKLKLVPEEGDVVTFNPNTYVITEVKSLALGEGGKNVFAYKLTVGT